MSTPTAEPTEQIESTTDATDIEQQFNKARGWTPENKPQSRAAEPPKEQPKEPAKEAAKEPEKETAKDTPKEPAKAEEKTEEKTKPDLENPSGLSPTASQKFNAIKASREEWKTKASTLEQTIKELTEKVKTLESSPKPQVDESEVKALKEEHARMSEELKRLNVERHPRFKAYFDQKTTEALSLAKNAVGAEKQATVEALLKQPPSDYRTEQLERIMEDLPRLKQGLLATAVAKFEEIENERKTAIAEQTANYDKLTQEEQAQQQKNAEAMKAKVSNLVKATLEGAQKFEAFKEVEGDSEHNAKVQNNKAFVNAFMEGKLSESVFAFTPVLAAEALHLREKVVPSLQDEIKKRDKIISDLQASNPKMDTPADKSAAKTEEEQDFTKVFAKNWPAKQ